MAPDDWPGPFFITSHLPLLTSEGVMRKVDLPKNSDLILPRIDTPSQTLRRWRGVSESGGTRRVFPETFKREGGFPAGLSAGAVGHELAS